ncbi:MAG TPA: restriction endonuclease [Gallionella sp.]|jgi:restriction system protein|nr:restriction endonuclease [Gallionella sp.]
MAIPDFQSLMLPLLKVMADGREYSVQETVDLLALQCQLTEEEKSQLLPSGRSPVFYNRIAWAKAHLKRAGLIERPRRGYYKISEEGNRILKSSPATINLRFLKQFPEYNAIRERDEPPGEPQQDSNISVDQLETPEELIEDGAREIRRNLAEEILQRIKGCSPVFFERLVVELLVKMGYGGTRQDAGRAIGRSGDEGIDGVIHEDRLGLDVIYLQAKRWESVVGRPEIQKFVGALQGQRAKKGVFITTSDFTKEAVEYVRNIDNKVVLINGALLANLMIDHSVGVSLAATYEIKKIDSDYFLEE